MKERIEEWCRMKKETFQVIVSPITENTQLCFILGNLKLKERVSEEQL